MSDSSPGKFFIYLFGSYPFDFPNTQTSYSVYLVIVAEVCEEQRLLDEDLECLSPVAELPAAKPLTTTYPEPMSHTSAPSLNTFQGVELNTIPPPAIKPPRGPAHQYEYTPQLQPPPMAGAPPAAQQTVSEPSTIYVYCLS